MPTYQLSRAGTWDYPTLGFRATNGDVFIGAAAPDAFWVLISDGPAETVVRYGVGSGTPAYTEPVDGTLLAYNPVSKAFDQTTAPSYFAKTAVQTVLDGRYGLKGQPIASDVALWTPVSGTPAPGTVGGAFPARTVAQLFDPTTIEAAATTLRIPDDWSANSRVQILWTSVTGTGDATWRIYWRQQDNGSAATGTPNGLGVVTGTVTTSGTLVLTTLGTNMALAPGSVYYMCVVREAANAADTLAADAGVTTLLISRM